MVSHGLGCLPECLVTLRSIRNASGGVNRTQTGRIVLGSFKRSSTSTQEFLSNWHFELTRLATRRPIWSGFGEEDIRRSCFEAVLTPYNAWNTCFTFLRLGLLWFLRFHAYEVESGLWKDYLEFRYSVSDSSKRTYAMCNETYGFLVGVIFLSKKSPDHKSSKHFVTANEAMFHPGLSENQNRYQKSVCFVAHCIGSMR